MNDKPLSQGRHLHRATQTQISMPRVGFEQTISMFKQAKTFHTLDRAATVTGSDY
jgi:hypothetical protein